MGQTLVLKKEICKNGNDLVLIFPIKSRKEYSLPEIIVSTALIAVRYLSEFGFCKVNHPSLSGVLLFHFCLSAGGSSLASKMTLVPFKRTNNK